MGVLSCCCGLYCSLTSLVGVYFFVLLAIMEFRGNTALKYYWGANTRTEEEWKHPSAENLPSQPSMRDKGIAFLILALIQLVFSGLCFWCGSNAMKAMDKEEEAEDAELAEAEGEGQEAR